MNPQPTGAKSHHLFGGSKAKIWLNCPGGLPLGVKLGIKSDGGSFATEGTAAHACCEFLLTTGRGEDASALVGRKVREFFPDAEPTALEVMVDQEMAQAASDFRDLVLGYMEPTSTLLVETPLDLYHLDPECGGSADAIVETPFKELVVFDFKYGRGVTVEAEDNEQMLVYALGASRKAETDFNSVTLIIHQPRCREGEPVKRFTFHYDELKAFEERASLALQAARKPDAPCVPGSWCHAGFCPLRAQCPALKQEVQTHLDELEQAELTPEKVVMMTPAEAAATLRRIERVEGWAKDLRALIEKSLAAGVPVPGFKLVEKRANRKWADSHIVEETLFAMLGDAIYCPRELKSPAQIEKLGKAAKLIVAEEGMTVRLSSGVTLADESDPRPAFTPALTGAVIANLMEDL